MRKMQHFSPKNYHFYSREISQYIAWTCLRNGIIPTQDLSEPFSAKDFQGALLAQMVECCTLDRKFVGFESHQGRGVVF